jgi:hypothetical protein
MVSSSSRAVTRRRAGELLTGDHRGVIVLATQMYVEEDENFYEPISVLGDVPDKAGWDWRLPQRPPKAATESEQENVAVFGGLCASD